MTGSKFKIPPNGNWKVEMRCTIIKCVYCENCTEHQAETNPFDHATQEIETTQEDWNVLKVESAE